MTTVEKERRHDTDEVATKMVALSVSAASSSARTTSNGFRSSRDICSG